ncbi:MAG: exosortase F system-associated protein [Flavobacterium sp.]|nr:exosortase F system-associated protein [Flavobacterium sp.]
MLDHKIRKRILVVLLVLLLVAIRAFESVLFYDPFIVYFKSEFSQLPYPKFNSTLFFLNLIFRYVLNGIVSLAIIYVIFKDVSMVKFSVLLLCLFLMMLLFLMFSILNYCDESHQILLFYVRRFLIQPIFLLLFLPAFYYQKKTS